MTKRNRTLKKALGIALLCSGLSSLAHADEITLRGVSCFPEGNFLSSRLEQFVEEVNSQGKGVIKINYLGGAPAIGSPFQLVDRVSKGVFDLVGCTGAYYQSVLPEAEALKLSELPQSELRENGGFELLSTLHEEKNLKLMARLVDDWPFYIYLNKEVAGADFTGLKIRSVPIYTPFLKALGVVPVDTSISDIFPVMENGAVDGFGWPAIGFLPDWYQVTKYRVEPGFYEADIQLLLNKDIWDGLDTEAQKIIQAVALDVERSALEAGAGEVEAAKSEQAARGIQSIVLEGDAAKEWAETARSVGWQSVINNSPEHGEDLRRLLSEK